MKTVKVPPTDRQDRPVCPKRPALDGSDGNQMRLCDRTKDHRGLCSWRFDELAQIDISHLKTLVVRLERAEKTPGTVTADELESVLRESRQALDVVVAAIKLQDSAS